MTAVTAQLAVGRDRLSRVGVLALAAVCWVVAVRRMRGMDMGVETELGSLGSFLAVWVPMMAAMMLPGAVPAIAHRRRVGAAAGFAAAYLAVWAQAGLAVHALYCPHDHLAAGLVTVAAGLYELTPLKRGSRRRCRERPGSGFALGRHCVGSTVGLMAVLLALGPMSVAWMTLVAALAAAQKLLPPTAAIDVPVALTIVALGVVVAI